MAAQEKRLGGQRLLLARGAADPSYAAGDRTAEDLADLVNKVVDGISGCTFLVHICFGSFRRLPYAIHRGIMLFLYR